MGTALLALCFCALSLVLALFVGISPISDKAKIRFMYVGAVLSLMAVPMMSHYIAGVNDIVDELRYQAVLVFIVVVCCYCFVMANMVKYNVMKKKVAVLEDTVEKLEQERAAAMSQAVDEEQQHRMQEALDWFAAKMSVFSKEEEINTRSCCISFDSYIKPQPTKYSHDFSQSCISFDSYIKPQRCSYKDIRLTVVYPLIPTSNHNALLAQNPRSEVVYPLIPTSNHNVLAACLE